MRAYLEIQASKVLSALQKDSFFLIPPTWLKNQLQDNTSSKKKAITSKSKDNCNHKASHKSLCVSWNIPA